MKKRFLLILVALLWCNLTSADETSNFEWIKNQTEFSDSLDLISDNKGRFEKLIKSNISTRSFFDFKDETLYQRFISTFSGPPDHIKYYEDRRYVVTSGCMAHACLLKGLVFIDTKEKYVIGLTRHYHTEPFDLEKVRPKSEDLLIFSKTHKKFKDLPELFLESVDDWIKRADDFDPINPQVIRFVGNDDKIIDVTNNWNSQNSLETNLISKIMTINVIPWILMFFITLVWTAGVTFKPNSMGGRESWGPVNFKISILWWISILFVFLTKVSPFYFIIMVPLSVLMVSAASGKAEVDHAIKNRLPAESIMTRMQPNTEALLPSLLYYSVFLIILYFANDFFF